jgi:hypothetical protein
MRLSGGLRLLGFDLTDTKTGVVFNGFKLVFWFLSAFGDRLAEITTSGG